jgi:hypothetical protein
MTRSWAKHTFASDRACIEVANPSNPEINNEGCDPLRQCKVLKERTKRENAERKRWLGICSIDKMYNLTSNDQRFYVCAQCVNRVWAVCVLCACMCSMCRVNWCMPCVDRVSRKPCAENRACTVWLGAQWCVSVCACLSYARVCHACAVCGLCACMCRVYIMLRMRGRAHAVQPVMCMPCVCRVKCLCRVSNVWLCSACSVRVCSVQCVYAVCNVWVRVPYR